MYLSHILFQFLTTPLSFIYGESLVTFLGTFRQYRALHLLVL